MKDIIKTEQIDSVYKMAKTILNSTSSGMIGQIIGEPGTGKTWATKFLEKELAGIRICAHQGSSIKGIVSELFHKINGHIEAGSKEVLLNRLIPMVSKKLVIVDEANHLRWQQLEILRYLADEGNMGLLLVGTDLLTRHFHDGRTAILLAQLSSRIGGKRIKFSALSSLDEFTGYILQPRFGDIDRTTAKVFFSHCKGYWREAVELAEGCQRILEIQKLNKLNKDVVTVAASAMKPRTEIPN